MKILIAGNQSLNHNFFQNQLEDSGYTVLAAEDDLKAWELFQKNKITMVIVAFGSPQMDGLALCRKIRLYSKDNYVYIIVAVAVAAKDKQKDIDKILKQDADGYITMPFDSQQFFACVKTGERLLRYEKEHKDMQNILLVSRNKLKIVFDSLQEEIVSIDKEYCIVSANRAFQENSEFPFSELIGKPYCSNKNRLFSEYFKETAISLAKYILKAFASGLPQNYFDVAKNNYGQTRYRRFSFLPIINDAGKVFQLVIAARDITERMQKSEEIKALNKKLQQAIHQIQAKNEESQNTLEILKTTRSQILLSEKMASVGQLAAGVAHEINNPVGFVSSNLRTLSDYQNDTNELIEHYRQLITNLKDSAQDLPFPIEEKIDHIATLEKKIDIDFILDDVVNLIGECKDGTERIKNIVLDLKDFAHPGENKLKFTDINKGIESTLNVVWNELKYKAVVTKDYGNMPLVECYPQQINQVFMNIFVNAAQAIENQGEIRILTREIGGRAEIKISDTGVGIPKENLSKIFDPFFTTKDVGKGTGLGMNIAYNIIKKHKGTIELDSTVGVGTTFTINIPVRLTIED